MDADLDTLVTALYVQVDDLLKANPGPGAVAAGGGRWASCRGSMRCRAGDTGTGGGTSASRFRQARPGGCGSFACICGSCSRSRQTSAPFDLAADQVGVAVLVCARWCAVEDLPGSGRNLLGWHPLVARHHSPQLVRAAGQPQSRGSGGRHPPAPGTRRSQEFETGPARLLVIHCSSFSSASPAQFGWRSSARRSAETRTRWGDAKAPGCRH